MRLRLGVLVAVCLLLVAGYQFWLRDSSLVAVEEVKVTGLTTKNAERVRRALEMAGQSMTTLHVRRDRLEQAAAAFPVVRAIEVRADFPHGLHVHVIERHPAAIVELGGRKLPVAGDGTVLTGMPIEGSLPQIDVEAAVAGERLRGSRALAAAQVAGAAPLPLLRRVESIGVQSDQGLVAELSEGPELIFGDASHARAKWIAAARVLADPEAEGATYIDLRLPSRPAAGGMPAVTLAPVAPADVIAAAPPQSAAGDATDPSAAGTTAAPTTATPGTTGAPTTVDPATGTQTQGVPTTGDTTSGTPTTGTPQTTSPLPGGTPTGPTTPAPTTPTGGAGAPSG